MNSHPIHGDKFLLFDLTSGDELRLIVLKVYFEHGDLVLDSVLDVCIFYEGHLVDVMDGVDETHRPSLLQFWLNKRRPFRKRHFFSFYQFVFDGNI